MDALNLEGTPLVLDQKIRDWVLIPIFIIVVLIGVLRTRVQALITGTKKADKEVLELQNLMQRSGRLRQNGHLVPWDAFSMRKQFLVGEKKRGLRQKVDPSIGTCVASKQGVGGGAEARVWGWCADCCQQVLWRGLHGTPSRAHSISPSLPVRQPGREWQSHGDVGADEGAGGVHG